MLVDLQGPKIRLGKFADGPHELEVGDIFTITTEDVVGTKELVGTTYKGLPERRRARRLLLIDDGKVTRRGHRHRRAPSSRPRSIVAGAVSNNKGINLPGVAVNVPALTEKDEDDLRWGLKLGADLIALSFVRSAEDVERVHEIMAEEGRRVPVIAKIEKPQAVDDLEEIIDAFDGDHGRARRPRRGAAARGGADRAEARGRTGPPQAKPVIVATQMLESMIAQPGADARRGLRRRERGARRRRRGDALGRDERRGVSGRSRCRRWRASSTSTEEHGLERIPPLGTKPRTQGGAITLAAAEVADFVDAKYVCVFTESGDSARRMSRLRSASR